MKLFKNGKSLRFCFHEIDPTQPRVVIKEINQRVLDKLGTRYGLQISL